jgi:hypothetical protein
MKVTILSESAADEAAIRILVDAVLGVATQSATFPRLEFRRGFDNVMGLLPAVLKHVYYQTDADGLVVVVDSNGTALHALEHEQSGCAARACRLCRIREVLDETRSTLRPVAPRGPLRIAVGLACPAVEAWYLCGPDPHATEAAWARDLAAEADAPTHIRQLKQAVFGTDRPGLALETERATAAARRLAGDVAALETAFPWGFGALARALRAWRVG